MAAIENLELVVTADISKALAQLEELQEELQDLAESIEAVDAMGTEGINIRTHLDDLDSELAAMQAKIEAFETANEINIDTDVDQAGMAGNLPSLMAGHDRGANELDVPTGTFAPLYDEMFDAFASADMDMGDFNVERGRGISGGSPGRLRKSFRKLSSSISDTRKRFSNFNLRMSDIHNLMASLIPLLVVFIGAVPAVVTALVGLATAAVAAAASLAALVGFGAMGVAMEGGQFNMQNLTEIWEEIRQDFIEAFAPLAERLAPLFMDAVDGLGRFFQAIANQGDALMELTDEARAFGGFLMDFVPQALQTLAAVVEALAPVFGQIGEWLQDNFESIARTLVSLTMQAIPVVAALANTIMDAIPTIVQIGIQFAHWANVILELIGVLWQIITVGGAFEGVMGHVLAVTLLVASAVALANRALVQFAAKALWGAITSLYRFLVALGTANAQMTIFGSTTLASAVSGLITFTANIIKSLPALSAFISTTWGATVAAAAFWTAVTLGAAAFLLPMISSMASGFLGLSGNIDSATSSLKEFDRVAGNVEGRFNPYEGEDPPGSGAGAAGGRGGGGGSSQTTINIESSGDPNDDAETARYVSFRQGRTTGGNN